MYVTRRFLRSTLPATDASNAPLPPAPPRTSTTTRKSPSHKTTAATAPTPSPRTANSSAISVRAAEPTPTIAELPRTKPQSQPPMHRTKSAAPTKPLSLFAGCGLLVDARDVHGNWCDAKILQCDTSKQRVFVHYVGWNVRYDAWVAVECLAAHGSHTGRSKRCKQSWNGKIELFARVGDKQKKKKHAEAKESKQQAVATATAAAAVDRKATATQATKKKPSRKRLSRSDDACDDASAQTTAKKHKNETKKEKQTKKKAKRLSVGLEAIGDATEQKVPASAVDRNVDSRDADAAPARRVTINTDNKKTKRKKQQQRQSIKKQQTTKQKTPTSSKCKAIGPSTAIADDVPANASDSISKASSAVDVDASDTNAAALPSAITKQRSNKHERKATKAKRTTPTSQQAPQAPPTPLSATRQQLAAIFRQRLEQQQQLQALVNHDNDANTTSLTQLLLPIDAAAASASTATRPHWTPAAVASMDDDDASFVHYQHAQQLQQFYYEQALRAATMNMTPLDDDLTESGVLDLRVIPTRLDALERQRAQQQQQLQQYYQQIAATRRTHNCDALAASQEFLTKSSDAWQQQQQTDAKDNGKEEDEKVAPTAEGAMDKTAPAAAATANAEAEIVNETQAATSPSSSCKSRDAATAAGETNTVLYEFVL